MRTLQVLTAIALLLLILMAVQQGRIRAHQQPLAPAAGHAR
jgi:hypothetical protein